MRDRRYLSLLVLFAFGSALAALAVEQTGDLKVLVRDEKGQPLPGTTLTLTGSSLQGERSAVTDAKGEFIFRILPPGPYSVKFGSPGYQTILQENIVVNVGRTTPVTVDLKQGELTEKVSVTGNAPLVDTTRTQTQDNYTPEYLEQVQIGSGGRDYLSVIQNTAGTGPGDGANPTVRGSTIGGNVYLIDGVDSTDPVTQTFGTNFIYDAIQEVQFQTGGFAAEYGRATGGVINVVTKSGGNLFSGSIDARYRNENFIEKGDHFDPGNFDIKREISEGTLGGPIVKDKLWFFLAGSYVRSDFATAGSPAVQSYNGRYYLGKLTWQINPNHVLIAQVTGDPATIDDVDASPLVAAEATSKQTQGSRFFTAQYRGALSSSVILQAQAAYYKSKLDFEPQDGDFKTIGWIDFFTGEQTRNSIDAQFSDRFLNQINATLTWNVPKLAGDHTFKFGTDVQKRKFEFDDLAPGGEFDQVAPGDADGDGTFQPGEIGPLIYNVVNSASRLSNEGIVTGSFAQDDWRIIPDLTFNLGLRYETFAYDDNRGRRAFEADLLEPRVGVAWDATGDAKNVFKVFGGRFADTSLLALPRVVNSRANSTDLYINENIAGWLFGDPPGPDPVDVNGDGEIEDRVFFTSFGGPGGEEFAHGGDLKMPSVVEYSASYERQFNPTTAASLTLVRRKTYDIIEDKFDQNRGIYIIDNLGQLDRNYYGAELRYRTAWKKAHFWASYNWSKSRGNIGYTQSLGSDFDFPDLRSKRYGYLSDDTRHYFRLNGYWDLPIGFQVGYGYAYISGYPFNQVRSAFPYGVRFEELRGSNRFSRIDQLDIDLRKGFHLGKTDLQVIVSVINVFDTETVDAVNTNARAHGQAIGFQTPRRYEIGAHYRF